MLQNSCNDRVLLPVVTNYRNRTGEFDLIMSDDQTLVFVEVKQRRNSQFGRPEASVDIAKQAKLRRTAASYLQRNDRLQSWVCLFDVVAITGSPHAPVCRWIQNASIKPYEETYIPLKHTNAPSTVRRS